MAVRGFEVPWLVAGWQRPTGSFELNQDLAQALGLVSLVPLTQQTLTRDLCQRYGAVPLPVNGPKVAGVQRFSQGYRLVSASDQYVNLGNPTALQITGAISIFAWYSLTTAPSGANFQLVTKDKDTGGRAYTLDVSHHASAINGGARLYINGGGATGTPNIAVEGRNPVAGDCRFVCGTYQPSTIVRMYVNGVQAATSSGGASDASIPTATANVLIGRREYAGFTEPFNGIIGHVGICNKTLTASEVANLYGNASWSLYWVPGRRVYFDISAGGGNRRRRVLLGAAA